MIYEIESMLGKIKLKWKLYCQMCTKENKPEIDLKFKKFPLKMEFNLQVLKKILMFESCITFFGMYRIGNEITLIGECRFMIKIVQF